MQAISEKNIKLGPWLGPIVLTCLYRSIVGIVGEFPNKKTALPNEELFVKKSRRFSIIT